MNLGDIIHIVELKAATFFAAAGGAIIRSVVLREPFMRAMASTVVGFLCALLFTDAAVDFFKLTASQHTAVAAALSMGGMTICEGALKYLKQWRHKPWLPAPRSKPPYVEKEWEE